MSSPKPPRISLPGGRFFDGDALLVAADNATPHARNTAVHLLNLYKAMTIRQGFLHKLTEEQLWRCTIIKTTEDWAKVSGRFMADVDLYRLLAIDTESLAPTSGHRHTRHAVPAPNRRLYAIASTVSGFTVLFDLEELNGGLPIGHKDLFASIPPPFRRWAADPEVFLLGSGILADLQSTSARVTSIVDTRRLWDHFLDSADAPEMEGGKLIKIHGTGNCNGQQVQALWAKGFPFKPMEESRFVSLFGRHYYTDANGNKRWPWFRRPSVLYRWLKSSDGHLKPESVFYLFHDSTCPVSFLLRLVLERIMQVGLDTAIPPDMPTSRLFSTVLKDFAFTKGGEETPDHAAAADGEDDDVIPLPPPHRQQVDFAYESEDVEEDEDAPPPAPGAPRWSDVDKANIPYAADPSFGRRCTACGSSSHSFYYGNLTACPDFLAPNREVRLRCLYELCRSPRGSHDTKVCPGLHHLCSACGCRGHYEEDGCAAWDTPQWENNRRFWEDAADLGHYTSFRHSNWALGFFGHEPFTPYPFPVRRYLDLARMPVLEARAMLRAFARGHWPRDAPMPRPIAFGPASTVPSPAKRVCRRRGEAPTHWERAQGWSRPAPPSLLHLNVAPPPGYLSETTAPPSPAPQPRKAPTHLLERVRIVRNRERRLSLPPASPPEPPVLPSAHSGPGRLQTSRARLERPAGSPTPPPRAEPSPSPPPSPEPGPSAESATSPLNPYRRRRVPPPPVDPEDVADVVLPPPQEPTHSGMPPEYPSSSDDDEALELFLRPRDYL